MSRKLILAAALFAASASAQQSVDISGADFSSGKGDARLAALVQQAAAQGKRVVITAPKEWHSSIAAKLGKKKGDVVLREGFYESVLARVEDKAEAAKPAKPEAEKAPARAAAVAAAAPVKEVEPEPAPAPPAKPVAVAAAAPAVAAPPPAPPAAVTPKPVPAAPAASKVAAKPAAPVVDVEAIRERLRESLIGGRPAQGSLAVASLKAGDVIYVEEPVRGVVRREELKAVLYWLDGDLDLRRSELTPSGSNRYQVVSAIRGEGSLRREFDNSKVELVATVPADGAPVRTALEKAFNEGRRIDDRLAAAELREGDVVYTGTGSSVVVRRDGKDLLRYWLDGSFDLRQSSVQADGPGKYRIRGSVTR